MALISASVRPGEDIPTFDIANANGRIAGFTIDGISVYLGGYPLPADKDAAIRDTANLLIGVLVGLRDAAARRIADAIWDAVEAPECGHCGEPAGAPSGLCAACESLVDEPQAAPLPDGVEFVGTVGQFLDSIEAPDDATYAGSRCCGTAEGTPHWVHHPNWARGVPENELRALAGDR